MLPAAASRLWGPRLGLGGAALRLARYGGGSRAPLPGRRAESWFGGSGRRAQRLLPRPSLRGVESAARPGRPWVQVPFVPSFPPLRPNAVDGSIAQARCSGRLGAALCTRQADAFHFIQPEACRSGQDCRYNRRILKLFGKCREAFSGLFTPTCGICRQWWRTEHMDLVPSSLPCLPLFSGLTAVCMA